MTDEASYGGVFLGLFGGDVDLARAAVIDGLVDGLAYFNIHTANIRRARSAATSYRSSRRPPFCFSWRSG